MESFELETFEDFKYFLFWVNSFNKEIFLKKAMSKSTFLRNLDLKLSLIL